MSKHYKQVDHSESFNDTSPAKQPIPIDWSLCILCQKNSQENLQCPANKSKRADKGAGYKSVAENLEHFFELGVLPFDISVDQLNDGSGIENTLVRNNASWHKSCKDAINNTKLKRAQKRKQQDEEQGENSSVKTRRSSYGQGKERSETREKCFFCNETSESAGLHKASTFEVDRRVRECALELHDTELLSKLACGDMVAIDAMYHVKCLVSLYNRSRKLKKKSEDTTDQSLPGIAFAELVSYIEEFRETCTIAPVFKLADLAKLYATKLNELDGVSSGTVNTTRLKDRLLAVFPDLSAHSQGRDVLLVFDKDIGDALRKACEQDLDSDGLHLAKAAKIIRREIFKSQQCFKGTFDPNCEDNSVPAALKALVGMILNGPSIKKQDDNDTTRACLTISQLLAFNSVKRHEHDTRGQSTQRHRRDREYPAPMYMALKIHGETRKRSLIDAFFSMGLCISYDRVITISTDIANSVCERFEQERVVCPPKLRSGIFTTAGVDNIDHNPSSTTAHDSFHGTAISLVQHPTVENTGTDRGVSTLDGSVQAERKIVQLPESFSNVPPAYLNVNELFVPPVDQQVPVNISVLDKEYEWLQRMAELAVKEELDKEDYLSWAAFHASKQLPLHFEPAIITLLPMFMENAHSVAMILHAMNVVKSAIQHVNPGQHPVIAMDQPLFAIAKQIQWKLPNTHGEHKFVIMFGGLHIEMAAFKALGTWLDGSGWTSVLVNADVATAGVAESFIKVSHLTRTRRAHQMTAASLYILQKNAYSKYVESVGENDIPLEFTEWHNVMSAEQPQFLYWTRVLLLELCILEIVRSLREGDFSLYVQSLLKLMPWVFALDHVNYSRWLSVHIRDMLSLPTTHPNVFQQFKSGTFVVHKTKHPFSAIALDHAHEQVNAMVKGDGGAVGLTESTSALRRWMIAGPEVARMITEFETSNKPICGDTFLHHEQFSSVQISFAKNVKSLVREFEELGNPFEEDSKDLFVLDTKEIVSDGVVQAVKNVIKIGQEQYDAFVDERFVQRSKPITEVIKKTNLPLFSRPEEKVPSKQKAQVAALKNDCALFSRLYIACQSRDGNLEDFFKHENQPWPPSLAQMGKFREGQKSDLVKCLESFQVSKADSPQVDVQVLDGAVIVQMLPPGTASTFQEYHDTVFLPYIMKQLQQVTRIDLIWDEYKADSLKKTTRENRGTGTRIKVTPSSRIPKNWKGFLRVDGNKADLFGFLAEQVSCVKVDGKEVNSTRAEHVLSSSSDSDRHIVEPCTHEEADTRVILHTLDASLSGYRRIMIRTNDTDVVVIAVANFQDIPVDEFWIAYGTGKHFRYLAIHTIARRLGVQKAKALPFFHALTGCDTVSFLAGKGKKTAWDVWNVFPEVTDIFVELSSVPQEVSDDNLLLIERFFVLLYDRTSTVMKVNSMRQHLFSKRARTLEHIPPTEAALRQHTLRAAYQAGHIWGQTLAKQPVIPSPEGWGWKREGDWKPIWTTLNQAQDICYELIRCGCKKGCKGQCKCVKANLSCTALCNCGGNCHQE